MKKLVFSALLSLLLVMGFVMGAKAEEYVEENVSFKLFAKEKKNPKVFVVIDKETGIHYICTPTGICPRYNSDGTLYKEPQNKLLSLFKK